MIFAALLGTVVLANIAKSLAAYAITYDEDGMPVSLSGDEFIVVRDTALSDPRVKELIDGRNYSITDCCGFYKGADTAAQWEPVINIRVANELQIAIRVDLDAHKVTGIETGPAAQFQPARTGDDNSMTSSIPFTANDASNPLLLIIVTLGIVLGGASAGVFYYVRRVQKQKGLAS